MMYMVHEQAANEVIQSAETDPQPIGMAPSNGFTEVGFAQRLIEQHTDQLRFAHHVGWLIWSGSHWQRDESGGVVQLAKQTIANGYGELGGIENSEQQQKAFAALRRLESAAHVKGILTLAESDARIRVAPEALDRGPMLLNVQNGTLNLRSCSLRPHCPADLLTKCTGTTYEPEAEAPRWHRFLDEIFDGDVELIEFIRRAVGYTLTAETGERVLFLMHGPGANGKSTLQAVLRALLGDYAAHADAESFLLKRGSEIRSDLARLAGARMVSVTEIGEGRRMAEALVKAVTGEDPLTVRHLYREHFEYQPTYKLWLGSNYKPTVSGTDYAIWSRILLLPFNVTIPPERRDPKLREALIGELPGILNWALTGCLAWQDAGLRPPESVRAATAEYRTEQDVIGAFIAECCQTGADLRAESAAVYQRYREWCDASGERARSKNAFGRELTERSFELRYEGGDKRGFRHGIGLSAGCEVSR